MDIPDDLEKLKRPALQKICKKFGVKANGKNADMIAALEAIRDNKQEASESVPSPMEEETPQECGDEGEEECQQNTQEASDEATPSSDAVAAPSTVEETMEVAARTPSPGPATEPEPSEDRTACESEQDHTHQESKMGRKRQRTRSLATATTNSSHTKKAKLHTPMTSSSNTATECPAPVLEEDRHPSSDDTLPNEDSLSSPMHSGANKNDDPLPTATSPGDVHQNCSATRDNPIAADLMDVPEPAETNRVESTSPPFTPPSGAKRSSQRKRKRNATYTKDSSESMEESTPSKRQRRATYELSPSSSFIRSSGSDPLEGPCDSTVAVPMERETSCAEAGAEDPVGVVADSDPVSTMAGSERADEDEGCNAKDDIMSLLEQRVSDRKADPSYVPVHNGGESRIPVKSQVQNKFDKAHSSTFSRMKSISDVYQEGVAKQKSLTERRVATPGVKKNGRRDSLTSRARATMKSVTPSKPLKRPESKKPWKAGKHTNTASGVGKEGFKPSNTASYKFSSTNKTVQFEGTLKSMNETDGVKKPSTPAASGSHSKTAAMKQSMAKKTKENSPVKSGSKKQTFDLQASLKKKNLSYKPYSGKLPPVHFKK